MSNTRKNKLEASAYRLGIKAEFAKRENPVTEKVEWCMVAIDGASTERFLGQNIDAALASFESSRDAIAYVGRH